MNTDIENARHAEERGKIMRVLVEDYARQMTSVRTVQRALDSIGTALSARALSLHLVYLSDQGYLKIWRGRDMETFRRDRHSLDDPDAILFCKLLPRGLQLVDGDVCEDPKVDFR